MWYTINSPRGNKQNGGNSKMPFTDEFNSVRGLAKLKRHVIKTVNTNDRFGRPKSLCGIYLDPGQIPNNPSDVTCLNCKSLYVGRPKF